jgi:hypothetical protein
MANQEQLNILKQGVEAWNRWREKNPEVKPDFAEAELQDASLREANFVEADLSGVYLGGADLQNADLCKANLRHANFEGSNLSNAKLRRANFDRVNLEEADLGWTDLRDVVFVRGYLSGANLEVADCRRSRFLSTDLSETNLVQADLRTTQLLDCNLSLARMVGADLDRAIIRGCCIYGVAAWDMLGSAQEQSDLRITNPEAENEITVDDIEVAQFIYLLLHNEKIRNVIDAITSKVVLILGRFSDERKAVLGAIREELRRRNYTPVMFDFDKPASKDLTGTVETLARMARFIIADLTDPSSIPYELATVVPYLSTTPVLPLRLKGSKGFGMFTDLQTRYKGWVLQTYEYEDGDSLISSLSEVLAPVEERVAELRRGFDQPPFVIL